MYGPDELRDLEIPRLTCPYPLWKSPHCDGIRDRFHEWFLSYAPFEGERRKKKVRATDYPYLAAVCWPASDRRRLWDIAALAGAFTERDSEYDAQRYGASRGKLSASAADVRAHFTTVTEPRWGPLFTDIWCRLAEHVPAPQLARFAEVTAAFLDGCIAYDEMLVRDGLFTHVEEYLDARYVPLGQLIDHMMVEISLGIDLGGVLAEPALQAVVRADVERVAVYQDILSLRKDLAEGEDAENIVLVIARSRNCPLPAAMAAACAVYDEKMARFDHLADRLAATPLGRRPDVRLFVAALRNFTAGLIEWTLYSARYTLRDASPWQARSHSIARPPIAGLAPHTPT
jgi:hypothetical protein